MFEITKTLIEFEMEILVKSSVLWHLELDLHEYSIKNYLTQRVTTVTLALQ